MYRIHYQLRYDHLIQLMLDFLFLQKFFSEAASEPLIQKFFEIQELLIFHTTDIFSPVEKKLDAKKGE